MEAALKAAKLANGNVEAALNILIKSPDLILTGTCCP